KSGRYLCKRCQSEFISVNKGECICDRKCSYCRNCLKMGKVRLCSHFYSLKEPNHFRVQEGKILTWEGTLSEQQKEASKAIVKTVKNYVTRILWVVTGAGKSEMLFEGIAYALINKKRVYIASPRIDVCLELAPRIKEAFPNTELAVLYGVMEEEYNYTQLVIATTHQLYRLNKAFDVLIIDVVDDFHFHFVYSLLFFDISCKKIVD